MLKKGIRYSFVSFSLSLSFIENIPLDATQKDLFHFFRSYGEIESVKVCKDKFGSYLSFTSRLTQLSRGTAFIKFKDIATADTLVMNYAKIPTNPKEKKEMKEEGER